MVLAAAMTYAGLVDLGWSGWTAFPAALAVMVLFALGTERFVLRPLVNQPQISLFMATIGLAFILEGASQAVWGSVVRGLDLGIPDTPLQISGILLSKFDLVASATAAGLVIALALFFQKTQVGRALRAVADDHQAALSVGIPLERIWAVVWAAAGAVALVSGLLWGSRLGVQFALTQIAFKALPVLILGGFTSIAGAIVGGLMVGASEKVAEVYLGPVLGGGIENWFPYVLALLFLLVRPDGLFGEKRIERV
jgi:branched-chain amino acid transport system permease protein